MRAALASLKHASDNTFVHAIQLAQRVKTASITHRCAVRAACTSSAVQSCKMAALDATAVSVAELLAACSGGDAARVRDRLDAGAPASAQDESTGESALMWRAAAGSAEIVSITGARRALERAR